MKKTVLLVLFVLVFLTLLIILRRDGRENFTIAKRKSVVCPIPEDKDYSIIPPKHKILIVQGNNYERVPTFYRYDKKGKLPIVPLKFSWNSDELTYYFVIQRLPGSEYSIKVSENVRPLITDGEGNNVETVELNDPDSYNEYLLDI